MGFLRADDYIDPLERRVFVDTPFRVPIDLRSERDVGRGVCADHDRFHMLVSSAGLRRVLVAANRNLS